jgi:thioredoxin 1
MQTTAVTLATFDREVLASDRPVIVDFWAPWCGPCLAVSPILDRIVAERPGELKLVKVDVDEEPELAALFRISGLPTIVHFRDGKAVAATTGARGKPQLEKALGLPRPAHADGPVENGGVRGLVARLAGRRS